MSGSSLTFLRVSDRAKALAQFVVIRSAKSHDGKTTTVRRSPIIDPCVPRQHTMAAPASRALRRCICTAKQTAYVRPTIGATQQRIQRRWQSDAAAPTNPKIATIVDQISQLTLLETADLVSTLKVRRRGESGREYQLKACGTSYYFFKQTQAFEERKNIA